MRVRLLEARTRSISVLSGAADCSRRMRFWPACSTTNFDAVPVACGATKRHHGPRTAIVLVPVMSLFRKDRENARRGSVNSDVRNGARIATCVLESDTSAVRSIGDHALFRTSQRRLGLAQNLHSRA